MKQQLRKLIKERIKEHINSGSSLYLPVGTEQVYLPVGIQTLFAFLPTKNEIDIRPLIQSALQRGIKVAIPRVEGPDLQFHHIVSIDGPFEKGAYELQEPSKTTPLLFPLSDHKPDFKFPVLILVPALAFTLKGDRLGKGKGYYDRFLASFLTTFHDERPEITLAGVSWSFQILPTLPVEKHDFPVDCVYTESSIIICRDEIH